MFNIKKIKEFLDSEGIKYKETFYKNYKAVKIVNGAVPTQMRHITDYCNNNGLFYEIDKFSRFYIY